MAGRADVQSHDRPAQALTLGTEGQEEQDSGGGISPIGPVVLAGGGVVLGAGLVAAAVGLVHRCPERVGYDEAMRQDVDAARSLGFVEDVLWIVGAGVALLGLVLTLTIDSDEGGEHAELELRSSPGGGLASLRWRFQ